MTDGPVVSYFGPSWRRQPHEVQVPTPVGQLCGLCEEPVEHSDTGTLQAFSNRSPGAQWHVSWRPVHYECSMRAVIGSVAHIEGRCSCYTPGAGEGDPPGVSRRQAARLAVEAFRKRESPN